MALYIYRVGGPIPQEILLQDPNLWKFLVVLGLYLDRLATAGLATVSQTDQIACADRSDRLIWSAANFGRQQKAAQD